MEIKYITFNLSEIEKINFGELLTSSRDTIKLSNNNFGILKYMGTMPPSIQSLETKSMEYSHSEILDLLLTEEWVIIYEQGITGNT